MMLDGTDTDTLIAMVLSMLVVTHPGNDVILEALVECGGDARATADVINARSYKTRDATPTNSTKRKLASSDLNGWINPGTATSEKPPSAKKRKDVQSPIKLQKLTVPASSASTTAKPVVNLMQVLRSPPTSKSSVSRLPPLTLSNPSMVAEHTPCTLHTSILPPELACKLFYFMVDLSQSWKRNRWWLFDRVVESPHRTSFFVRKQSEGHSWHEAAQYWYNGRPTDPPDAFPDLMEEACHYIENIVNEDMLKRGRLPLEWAGHQPGEKLWHANVAAAKLVGPHSDQLTYLGPYPTIASLSLGTTRTFRLRESGKRQARTFNVPLPHNSLIIMHAATQESYKHSIPPQSVLDLYRPLYPHPSRPTSPLEPSNCRINITFRFYRPDFNPQSIPRCKCGVPTILRADMKNRHDGKTDRYWWTCYAGAQNDGKGCDFWRVMDMKMEGRGPTFADRSGVASNNETFFPHRIMV
ncbi:hypothetical protein F5J12DRAFT_812499 [Pisolithus orientalis]|uniref:uncharacterized protein n=1 Tax=Pisolithus orientalis TaxID=936130 RepID=UPI002224430A|nr:uncharacterized protein F5J12DRAFT_812499 [Pisolithus orientalis]KAI6019682.1 hypothetical protein F5J12DRAFT_812499 [Pisolithus orientalis]